MMFSFELPTQRVEQAEDFVTAEAVAELTRAAAAAGFAAVNVSDHPAPDTRWLDRGGHHALDPFVALSFAAAADPDIRLLTNIYVAAYRSPFLGANLVHSLDVLSRGRLILGVAAGYLEPEFAALGVDFERRGALLDQALEVIDATFSGKDVAFEGDGVHARGVRLRPLSRSGRRPPVWVGGNSEAAMRRAARFDGWAPFHTGGFARTSRTVAIESLDRLEQAIRSVRALVAAEADVKPFDICWSELALGDPGLSVDERCSRIEGLAAAGVTWIPVSIPAESRSELLEHTRAFGREIIAQQGARP